jgi:hypothetical protein
LALSGCGTVHHNAAFVPDYQPSANTKVTIGEVVDAASKTKRDNEFKDFDVANKLRQELETQLRNTGLYADSTDTQQAIRLSARVVDYEPGDAFKRWLMPGYGVVRRIRLDAPMEHP